ncbi:MAG TPA: CBS domain-containing protein [Candidatus Obscuribacterales bacterium]
MQLVLAHTNTDFDSLASQYAVSKLYPDTRIVSGRSLTSNIRDFFALYRDMLPLVEMPYVDAAAIKHVFIVDCQQADRLEHGARQLIEQKRCTYTIFDHHEVDPSGLLPGAREDSIVRPAGACTTLLVEKMRQAGTKLSDFEATLLAIGIYEDSGCLTYGGTTPADAESIAYLLEQGVDLAQVSSFINPKLDQNQTQLFQTLVNNAEQITVSGAKIVVSSANCEHYIEGLATLTRRLVELVAGDAAITVVHMRDRVHVVARSDTRAVNVRDLARAFGGGGHPGAASAVVKNRSVASVVSEVIELLKEKTKPEPTAQQIMRTPVRSISEEVTMEEAARLMLRYDEDGLIVTAGDEIVGVVSKRDIDKALHHKLGHAPVKGFMSRPVTTVLPDSGLRSIQEVMVSEDIGRLPVVDDRGKLKGIVTRREVLRTLFGGNEENGCDENIIGEKRRVHLKQRLQMLDPATDWLFHQLGSTAQRLGMAAYAVGGCVRDLILGHANFDLDFVIEGNAIRVAKELEQLYPGRFEIRDTYDRFQTATLSYFAQNKRLVDLATARIEFYEHPAALPTVEASRLEQDLLRRDFTINALAICLNPDEYGDVIDFFHGIEDTEHRVIRVLHKLSFFEDPTRIIRAARFAARLGFELEPATRRQAERAINESVFDNLGGFRLKEELRLILESSHRLAALGLLNDLGGGLRYLASDLIFDDRVRSAMRRAERLLNRNPLKDSWIVFLGTMLAPLERPALEAVMERLNLANDERHWIRSGLLLLEQLVVTSIGSSPPRSEIYAVLHGHSDQALAIAASVATPGSSTRRWIKLYLDELRDVRIFLSGNDLIKIGFEQGPQIKAALDKVKEAKLDGRVRTPAQELEFIRKHYPGSQSRSE